MTLRQIAALALWNCCHDEKLSVKDSVNELIFNHNLMYAEQEILWQELDDMLAEQIGDKFIKN